MYYYQYTWLELVNGEWVNKHTSVEPHEKADQDAYFREMKNGNLIKDVQCEAINEEF